MTAMLFRSTQLLLRRWTTISSTTTTPRRCLAWLWGRGGGGAVEGKDVEDERSRRRQRSYWRSWSRALRPALRRLLGPSLGPADEILQIGAPVLRAAAREVAREELGGEELRALVRALVRAMRASDSSGISAPQIGRSLQVMAIEVTERQLSRHPASRRAAHGMAPLPLTVVVNPRVTPSPGAVATGLPEACASLRRFAACVPRFSAVRLSGLNERGDEVEMELSGFAARVAQHEFDHLHGRLYVDIMDPATFIDTHWQE